MNARKEDCYDGPYEEWELDRFINYPPPGMDQRFWYGIPPDEE